MHTLPKLEYSYDALEPYIDGRTMEIHHGKHHQAYVDNLNAALEGQDDLMSLSVEDLLTDLNKIPADIRQKVINHGGGHANHSFFWKVIGPDTSSDPQGDLKNAIEEAFDSVDSFKEKFETEAMGRFGSGWAWLLIDNGKLEVANTANQDSPLSQGKQPILGLDVWEHAYYLKYQNRRAEYVTAWWNVVNWEEVERLYEKYK